MGQRGGVGLKRGWDCMQGQWGLPRLAWPRHSDQAAGSTECWGCGRRVPREEQQDSREPGRQGRRGQCSEERVLMRGGLAHVAA